MRERNISIVFISFIVFMIYSCSEKKVGRINEKNDIGKSKRIYKSLTDSIKESFAKRDYSKTKEYLKKYLNVSYEDKNDYRIGKGFYRSGIYYSRTNELDSAYYFFKSALPFLKNVNDSIKLGETYLSIAIIEEKFNDFNNSRKNSVKALKYFSNKDSNNIASVHNNLGIIARKKKEFNDAISHYTRAINFSNKEINIITYKNNIANLYGDIGKYIEAIKIFDALLLNPIVKKKAKLYAKVLDNLAYKKWRINSNNNVLKSFLKAEKIRLEEKDKEGLIASYAHLSDYYIFFDKKISLEYAYKMLDVAEKQKKPNDIIEAYDKIKVLETPKQGVMISIKRSTLKDSIEFAKEQSQNKFAYIKYESEENEKKAIENERIATVQRLVAQEQKSQKQQWIFTAIALLLASVTYFYYRRQKTKKEKVIEVYKTETRLAKRIHDELANDVYLTMNKLQNGESYSQTTLLSDLENIYIQTRDISHENSPVVTGAKFQEFLQQLFIDFSTDNCKVISKGVTEVGVENIAEEKQIVLYRVLQELLINMDKHSKATIVVISFTVEKNRIKIQYKDNGQGTTTIKLKSGLQNMETRIKSIGGSITFDSEKQQGFLVKFQFKK